MIKYVRIEVTQEDIDKGIKTSCSKCPIARAAIRHFNRPWITVTGTAIRIYDEYPDFPKAQLIGKYMLPIEAKQFISIFDSDGYVTPISFEVHQAEIGND